MSLDIIADTGTGDSRSIAFFASDKDYVANTRITAAGKRDLTEPVRTETTSEPYALWGADNLRPQQLIQYIEKSDLLPTVLDFKRNAVYGQGLAYGAEALDKTGKVRLERVLIPEIDQYFKEIAIKRYLREAANDWYSFRNFFVEFRRNLGAEVIDLGIVDAAMCRLQLQDSKTGLINGCYVSANWAEGNAMGYGEPIHAINPYFRVAQQIRDSKKFRHIVPMREQRYDRIYYDRAQWEGLIDTGWLDLASQIPTFKRSLMKNQLSVKWHIQIPDYYWNHRYKDWESKEDREREKIIGDVTDEFIKFMKGEAGAGNTFISHFQYDKINSKEHPGWRILPIINDTKGGEYIEDSQEADFHIARACGVSAQLIQAHSKGQSSGSGSDIRVAFNQHVLQSKGDQDFILEQVQTLADLNYWDKRFATQLKSRPIKFWFESYFLATLDQVTNESRM